MAAEQQVSSTKKPGFTSYTDGFEPEDGASSYSYTHTMSSYTVSDGKTTVTKAKASATDSRGRQKEGVLRAHNDKVFTEERVRAKDGDEWEKSTKLHGSATVEAFEKGYDESVKSLRGEEEKPEEKPAAIEEDKDKEYPFSK